MKTEHGQLKNLQIAPAMPCLGAGLDGNNLFEGVDLAGFFLMLMGLSGSIKGQPTMLKYGRIKPRYALARVAVVIVALSVGGLVSARAAELPVNPTVSAPALDSKHLFALGMLETGNNDRVVGGAGEVSRFQILPAVWRAYCGSQAYSQPEVSVQVARAHWTFLANAFVQHTGRSPSDFDMYVLWNTGAGYYARKGFDSNRVAPTVKDRAQRFVNLVNRHEELAVR
jgi:hypothetical protein